MIGEFGPGHRNAGRGRLFHQDAQEHIDLCMPARVQVLQGGKTGVFRAGIPVQNGLRYIYAVSGADGTDLLEHFPADIFHMLRIKIGPVWQVQDGLGQVVTDIGGIFGPLIPQDILHKESAAGRIRQQILDGADPVAFFTAPLLTQIDAPAKIRIKGDDLLPVLPLPAFGADPHQGVDDLRRVHDRRDLLFRINPVQKRQDDRIRRYNFPDILQNGFQGCILDRDQEQIDAPRFFRCPYGRPEGPDLLFVIDGDAVLFQAFFSGTLRYDAEI